MHSFNAGSFVHLSQRNTFYIFHFNNVLIAAARSVVYFTYTHKIRWEVVSFNLLKPTGHVMHQQFNIKQLYALPTLYLCVLYLSENKQRLVPLTA